MELSLETPRSRFLIRHVDPDAVTVGDKALRTSFVVTPEALHEDWPECDIDDVDAATVARLLAIEPTPDVILLGTGQRQHFAPAAINKNLGDHGIGLECMDNAACARTFNLLVNEGRHVAAAFLIP